MKSLDNVDIRMVMRRSRRFRDPDNIYNADNTQQPRTWADTMRAVRTRPAQLIDNRTQCCICLESNFIKSWMVCPTCNRPVAHTLCIRRYLVDGDYGAKYCPACGDAPITQRDNRRTNFPDHWECTQVYPVNMAFRRVPPIVVDLTGDSD